MDLPQLLPRLRHGGVEEGTRVSGRVYGSSGYCIGLRWLVTVFDNGNWLLAVCSRSNDIVTSAKQYASTLTIEITEHYRNQTFHAGASTAMRSSRARRARAAPTARR